METSTAISSAMTLNTRAYSLTIAAIHVQNPVVNVMLRQVMITAAAWSSTDILIFLMPAPFSMMRVAIGIIAVML